MNTFYEIRNLNEEEARDSMADFRWRIYRKVFLKGALLGALIIWVLF